MPDPRDDTRERWWDGIGWTEFTRLAVSSEGRRVTTRTQLVHRPDDATRSLAVLVGSPVWVGALYWIESSAAVPLLIRMQPHERPLLKLGFFVLVVLLLVLFAELDRRALRARGFDPVPSSLWAFATPIAYLAKRGRVVDGADRGPLLIHLVLLAISVLGVLLGIAFGVQQLAV
jgi:hypothetical protein